MLEVTADLDRVRIRLDGRPVADHARVWARGRTVTDLIYPASARLLRERLYQLSSDTPAAHSSDLGRDLADYDRAFGLLPDSGEVAWCRQEHPRVDQTDPLPRSGVDSTPDRRTRRPVGRPGPGCRLGPRGLPGPRAGPGSVRRNASGA